DTRAHPGRSRARKAPRHATRGTAASPPGSRDDPRRRRQLAGGCVYMVVATSPQRYAVAGASGRALSMYARPLRQDFADAALVVGVFDGNHTRARLLADQAGGVPTYDDFDLMLHETRPDHVIVTTIDRYHHDYII